MRRIVGWMACLGLAFGLRGDAVPTPHRPVAPHGMPPVMLWAWETPEDLRALDPTHAGVAFLAERITLGEQMSAIGRRQRILTPEGIWAEAVVRVETAPDFRDSEELRATLAHELARIAALKGIQGLQVDFDATRSQREFYADVLRRTKAELPPGLGLSMTALVSWCAVDGGWLRSLPVDEAVPMYFRFGKQVGNWPVREPLCTGAKGLSTDELETAPNQPGGRVYLFAPRPWTQEQIAVINAGRTPVSAKGAR